MFHFQQRLKNFKQSLKLWNKQHFGNIFEAQRNLNDQMKLIQIQIRNQGLTEDLKACRRIYSNNSWRSGVLKRKSCGGKNLEYNGFKKGNETPNSSTVRPSNADTATALRTWSRSRGKLSINMKI
jgi:hypothetical protein